MRYLTVEKARDGADGELINLICMDLIYIWYNIWTDRLMLCQPMLD